MKQRRKFRLPWWGWALGIMVLFGAIYSSTPEGKAQIAEQERQEAAQAAARAKEDAQRDATRAAVDKARQEQLAKQSIDQATFEVACENVIKQRLKLPDTARFRGFWEAIDNKPTITETNATWRSWVEAENSFGGTVRNDFVCRYEKATNRISVEMTPR